MRSLPIDTSAIRLLATGEVSPVAVWAELSDGSRRPVPDAQEKDDAGTPLWNVGAILPPADESERAELLSVRVASWERPSVAEFAPVVFGGLVVRVSVNRRSGQLAQYWSAAQVMSGPVRSAERAS